jgi:ABC-type nitrate/sulfonate/bicarbonate transport system substrate-binding protein
MTHANAMPIQKGQTNRKPRRNTMAPQHTKPQSLTRRRCLAAGAAGALAIGLPARLAAAATSVRQGYQTNIWGMPTYYLLKSGYLEKHGIAVEEFAVPSGNLTMQQMVARQVDLGTYAAQSFIIGNAKGGLIAIALIEHVGKTARITTRKDLNITKVEELRGRRIANQTGSSVGNVFVDSIMPQHGLKKGDYVEVRMDVNNMVAALAAKTVDAMVNVEPYNVIAVADGIGSDLVDFSGVDSMPVFMAATPDFVQSKPDAVVAYLKAWLDVANDFKAAPQKVADVIYKFYADKGYNMSLDTFTRALSRVEVNPGFPRDFQPYMQQQAEILLADKKVSAIPDWKTALRPDFIDRARGAS